MRLKISRKIILPPTSCPRCGAGTNAGCRSKSGRGVKVHKDRWALAETASVETEKLILSTLDREGAIDYLPQLSWVAEHLVDLVAKRLRTEGKITVTADGLIRRSTSEEN